MSTETEPDPVEGASTSEPESLPLAPISKSTLIRDAVVFQVKLLVDGFRDVVLIPVSLAATVISLLKPGSDAGTEFYEVVAFGRQTERSINLFRAADRLKTEGDGQTMPDLDGLVDDVEHYLRGEYASERFSGARDRLRKVIDSFEGRDERDAS